MTKGLQELICIDYSFDKFDNEYKEKDERIILFLMF